MACSYCGGDGHNRSTCPRAVTCSRCRARGHNARSCPNTVRCSRCGGLGHNKATCTVNEPTARAYWHDLEIQEDMVAIPRGPRHKNLHLIEPWFHRDLLFNDDGELGRLKSAIAASPRYERFKDALRRLVARVHRASRFEVYVGRAGATPQHLVARFRSHERDQRALFISPVFRARTRTLRDEDWEGRAIRLVRHWEKEERLCCNNSVGESVGRWPETAESVLYVVAAQRVE